MYRRFLNFGLSAAMITSLTIPIYKNTYKCIWPFSKKEEDLQLQKNRLKNRLNILQYPANTPNEDAVEWAQLQGIAGYALAIFDGHGGNQVSQYLKKTLIKSIDQKIAHNKATKDNSDIHQLITSSISQAFQQAQEYIISQSKKPQGQFLPKQGACGLVALVVDSWIYIANLGDSKGIVLSVQPQGKPQITQLNKRMNINLPQLGGYLNNIKSRFDEKKLLTQVGGKLYLTSPQGKLQITGSFGDLFMKKFQPTFFNKKNKQVKNNQNKPLITSKPQISFTEIKQFDKYLLLASDGLWNQIKEEQITELFKSQDSVSEFVLEEMLQSVVKNIAEEMKKQPQFIRDLPSQIKPQVYDDISILLVDLKNQVVIAQNK